MFEKCGDYDESMRSGFEDWDFFLSILESEKDSYIGIADEALLQYRTTPTSSNVKSMEKRLDCVFEYFSMSLMMILRLIFAKK